MIEQPRVIGHVVSVHGFRLKVELTPEFKSSSRATLDGVQRAVAINSFLTFDLGAGTYALGNLTDLEARETFDPVKDEELSLELTKPRRVASVQLLGTVRQHKKIVWRFDTGITVLPTLDTPAEVADPDILASVFGRPPERNRPQGWQLGAFDHPIELGHQTGDENTSVKASFNDLFSRPLAVVGNTGSGKSYTVASLVRGIIENEHITTDDNSEPHVFILDINGEYGNAFLDAAQASYTRAPNKLYLNGEEFCLPAWLMNGEEVCDWLNASEATQEPVLKDWWAISKSRSALGSPFDPLSVAIGKIDAALAWLDGNQPASSFILTIDHAKQYASQLNWEEFEKVPRWNGRNTNEWRKITNDRDVRELLSKFRQELYDTIFGRQNEGINFAKSADSPRYIALQKFRDPELVDRSIDYESNRRIDQYLLTLKLRLRTRLDDRRWQSFFSFEDLCVNSFGSWMTKIGIGASHGSRVSIFDLSMLSSEVLPFACSLIGRILLETREMLRPEVRYRHPWVLVLEEAHNYARPPRAVEDRSLALSRRAFERVAKEGRKFGLSLIVASQRPSEISPTIISQCANFFAHRLQNPDDIDHFRRIIPRQAQRLLDQVTVLASGEAIVFGSAVHVPSRVQIKKPRQEPWSTTAAPFADWSENHQFPMADVLQSWGLAEENSDDKLNTSEKQDDLDDDIPF